MSDTPRTDKEAYDYETGRSWLHGVVSAHFARQLERENAALRAKVAAQGLSLACLADGILGEDASDRSDQTLVRVGCQMAGEVAALRADKERLDWMQNGGNAVDDVLYDMNVVVDFDVRAAIDAARKEQP